MALSAALLLNEIGASGAMRLGTHSSDTVRGWAAYMLGGVPDVPLAERLAQVRPLADDPHFGVRGWAWLAVRPHVAGEIQLAINLLVAWTTAASDNVRRFASDVTRPRGVWCSHISTLKRTPAIALSLLEPLRADPSGYVQDSVANWLNDASKDQPDWVRGVCTQWRAADTSRSTERICARALRSL